MKLIRKNNHLLYERRGRLYLIDTGAGFEFFEDEGSQLLLQTAVQMASAAVGTHVDGIVSFLPNGRIALTNTSVETEQVTDDPLPHCDFLIPWERITNNIPVVRMKVNGEEASMIVDTGALYMFSMGNEAYVMGRKECGRIPDYLAMSGVWEELQCYDGITLDYDDFHFKGKMLLIPRSFTEYQITAGMMQSDMIISVPQLLEQYDVIIDGQRGLGLKKR